MKTQQRKAQEAERLRQLALEQQRMEQARQAEITHQQQLAQKKAAQQQAMAQHRINEANRLQAEKNAWYNQYVSNMNAVREPWQREWYRHFSIDPLTLINNQATAIQPIKRGWGGVIIPGYSFTPRSFTG